MHVYNAPALRSEDGMILFFFGNSKFCNLLPILNFPLPKFAAATELRTLSNSWGFCTEMPSSVDVRIF